MRILSFVCIACILLLAVHVGAQPEPDTVRVGTIVEIYSGVNVSDARAAMQLWIAALVRGTEGRYTGISVVFESMEQAIEAIRRGELEGVNLSSIDFLRTRELMALEPATVGMFAGGQVMQEFVLLVRGGEGSGGLADLQGKELLVNRLDWKVARLWLEVLLHREGLPESRVHFGQIAQVEGASNQVLRVFFGQADACIVTARRLATLAELNPQLERELTVVVRSPALLPYLHCMVPGLGEERRRDFMNMAQSLHRDHSGRQMLTLFGLERTAPFRAEYLQSMEELVAEYEELTGEKVK